MPRLKCLNGKRLLMALLLLTTLVPGRSEAQPQGKALEVSLNGTGSPVRDRGQFTMSGQAEGSVGGSFRLDVQYDPQNKNVIGGSWRLAAETPNAKEHGAVFGRLTGGTVKVDDKGVVTGAEGVTIVADSGSGRFNRAEGATGTIEFQFEKDGPSVKGRLTLSF